MQSIITFEDKVALNENADIPAVNKVRDVDINEIKAIVNDSLQGTNAMGSIVVDNVTCKNLFDRSTIEIGRAWNWQTGFSNRATGYIKVQPNKTYTFSTSSLPSGISVSLTGKTELADGTALINISNNTFTTPTNCYYIMVQLVKSSGNISKSDYENVTMQLEIGSEATSYTEYKNFENEEVYSESEIKIGTWIDGKLLYRKVFTITSLTSSNTNLVDVSGLSIDFAKISGIIITSTGAKFPLNLYDSASNYSTIFLSDTGYIRGRAVIGSGTLSKCIVILEYTKTTSGTRMLSVESEEENR